MKKVLLVVALMPLMVFAESETIDNVEWTYSVTNGSALVNRASPAKGVLTIPSSLGGFPVTRIAKGAFMDCREVKRVTIPSSVTSLEERAFAYCRELMSVTMSEGLMNIGVFAFEGCSALTSLTLPSSVTSLAGDAFAACDELTNIVVKSGGAYYCSVDGILYNAVRTKLICCPKRKKGDVTIPLGVTDLEKYVFAGCRELTRVTIPSSVTSIDEDAFWNCDELMEIEVEGSNAFYCSVHGSLYNKVRTKLIHCPKKVKGDVIIPLGLTSIEKKMYTWRGGLKSLTIPSSVTNIGAYAFLGCDEITNIVVESKSMYYCSTNGVLYNKAMTELVYCSKGKTGDFAIPSSVMRIGEGAFEGCRGLTGVTLPSSVRSIGKGAFWCCSGLKSLTIPSSVTNIGAYAFLGCDELKTH